MDLVKLQETLKEHITPLLERHQFELVDFKVRFQSGKVAIEILADHPGGGIGMDDCAFLNKQICDMIDHEGMMTHSYVVIVSSPGLDRPLTTLKDFLRVKERKVHVILDEPIINKHEWVGVVKTATEDHLTIAYQQHEKNVKSPSTEKEIQLPLNKIKKAMQII